VASGDSWASSVARKIFSDSSDSNRDLNNATVSLFFMTYFFVACVVLLRMFHLARI
jgi:hypothetical protein